MTCLHARSIREVPGADWDRLAASHVLVGRGWLGALEQAGIAGLRPHYIMASDAAGLGAAACLETTTPDDALLSDRFLLGPLADLGRMLGIRWLPALVCGPYRGQGGFLLGTGRAAALEHLEALAAERRLPLVFTHVPDEDVALCELLSNRDYHRTVARPVACLDLRWSSFEEYVASLRRNARSAAWSEIRRCREAEVAIEPIANVEAVSATLHALADRHYRRRNGRGVPFGPAFLPAVKHRLGEAATFWGAYRAGSLLGFALMVRGGDIAHMTHVGLAEGKTSFAYFNLCYYRPIAEAIASGARRIWYGTLLSELKARRGCRLLPTSLYYRDPSRSRHLVLAPLFRAHRAWKSSRLKAARIPDVGQARRS
ncbi:MAG: GNAT family N-acetyltransferase [Geminicoccaceae bacterium]